MAGDAAEHQIQAEFEVPPRVGLSAEHLGDPRKLVGDVGGEQTIAYRGASSAGVPAQMRQHRPERERVDRTQERVVRSSLTPATTAAGMICREVIGRTAVPRSGDSGCYKTEAQSPSLANRIASGHSYGKHVIDQNEYPEVTNEAEFENIVQNTIDNSTAQKSLDNGRYAWWNSETQTVVIEDPNNSDGGTAFRPTSGYSYYLGLH